MVSMVLLLALVAGIGVSLVACGLALGLFPWFRSGERKPGEFRPDQSSGGARAVVVTGRRKRRVRAVRSSELPLVGGAAMVLAIVGATVATGVFMGFDVSQWTLVAILLGAMVGFAIVGFMDDWRKVHRDEGISELAKFTGVVIVSLAAAIALDRLIPSARFAYPPYADVPGLGGLLKHTHYIWIAFFVLMTVTVASSTSLAVDFSDGLDGLSGGLLISAALSFAIIILSQTGNVNWPSVLVLLAMVGALLGYLPFNLPSSYKAHGQGRGRRRARLIMGDTGALALGGLLALVTVITRLELLLPFIGGVFVLEGVSALAQGRILVKFFRTFLYLPRFGDDQRFKHTEFPLPFLATPMHHHYDLLGWDRQRLVFGAWTLGAGLATLGVASAIAPFTWERYLARFVALVVILAVWQSGPWTRSFFVGLVRKNGPSASAQEEQPARLGLFYGFPYKLFGHPLYSRVDVVDATEEVLQSPAERLGLWQRCNVFDARAVLGFYCYRAGAYRDAVRVWSRIPQKNVEVRPDLGKMLARARHLDALEADGELPFGFADDQQDVADSAAEIGAASSQAPYAGAASSQPQPVSDVPSDPHWSSPPQPASDPASTEAVWPFQPQPQPPVDSAASGWPAPPPSVPMPDPALSPLPNPSWPSRPESDSVPDPHWPSQIQTGLRAARLEPVGPESASDVSAPVSVPPMWSASSWPTGTASSDGHSHPYESSADPAGTDGREEEPRVSPRPPYTW